MQEIKKGWKKVRLGDIIDFFDNRRIPLSTIQRTKKQGNYPYYGASGIIDYIDDFIFDGRYLLISEDGANLTERNTPIAFFAEGKFWVNNHSHIILGKSNIADTDFIMYWFSGNDIGGYITGAAQPKLSQSSLSRIEILLPPLSTQQKIASILSKYDDLIENNNKRINILEETAQSIYEEWFVKYNFPGSENIKMIESGNDNFRMIPEGWEVKKIGDIINIPKGKNITKATVKEGIIPVVAGGLSPSCYHNISNTMGPVITISASGANAGYVNFYYDDIWASDCSYIDGKVTNFVYFWYLQLINRQVEITGLQRGSAQPHVYPKDIMGLLSLYIPENLLNDFEEIVSKLFLEIGNIKKQNQNLKETRDLLIPRLVSGELDVESLDVK
ncbi:MAG: restriction endonuclease subunit S [Candidatus Gracilibacteria bacterium]|nr:restriction endonuclease subunit S [Candidatus Gracilibacteria bacterium]